MRLSRRQLRRLLEEQYQLLNEAAKNWDEYINSGSSQSKTDRESIRDLWMGKSGVPGLGGNKEMYPDTVKSSASPSKFSKDYKGWTKWYFACIKDKNSLKLIGKENKVGQHINPSEMAGLMVKMIPRKGLEDAIAQTNDQMVKDFMKDIHYGSALPEPKKAFDFMAELEKIKKTSGKTRTGAEKEMGLDDVTDATPSRQSPQTRSNPDAASSRAKPISVKSPSLKEGRISRAKIRKMILETLKNY